MSHLADGLKHFRGEKRATGIVQIGKHNEAGGGRDRALQFFEADREARFEAARKALDAHAKIVGDIEERAVGGLLDEDFVAGIEQRGHGQVVRHGGARRRDHALLGDTGVLGKTALERGVTVIAGRGDFEFVEVHREFAARNAEEAARREIVFGVRSGLGPFHVQRTLRASGTAHALVASRLLLLARQKKYTGKPATAMSRPIVERRGSWAKVLRTTSHSAAMNSKVVQGWPGTR